MNKIFSRMTFASLALCLGFATGAANAQVTQSVTLTGSATAGYGGTFGQTVAGGAFNHIFSFLLPADSSASGGANTISLGGATGFSFTRFNLFSDLLLTNLVSTGVISNGSTVDEARLSFSSLAAPATYYLNVRGANNSVATASYAGNINISPVPEPETYAMLLAGLGLVGFAARRRKNSTFA